MQKLFLLLAISLLLFSCNKEDDGNTNQEIDINTFPLILELQGYINPNIRTYTQNGEIPSTNLEFNVDGFFNDKTYFFDTITFFDENTAALSLSYLPENDSFNQSLSNCQVSYLPNDTISFFIPANGLDVINDFELFMEGKDRSELKSTYYQTKLFNYIDTENQITSYASFAFYKDVTPLLSDLQENDTISVQDYQLVYLP